MISLSPRESRATVGLLSTLVVLGLCSMDEFMTVMVGVDGAVVEQDLASESFLKKLAEFYSVLTD